MVLNSDIMFESMGVANSAMFRVRLGLVWRSFASARPSPS
jgi:hypothetical protein